MQNGIPVGLRSSPSFGLSRSGQLTAIIQSLFWDGSQGWWYDDNDTTTLFQDSAGTTPVTAVEQFVGLQLDKSKGLVLGPELVTNGSFTTDTDWTKGVGWTISGGAANANIATGSNLDQTATTTSGKFYAVTYTVLSYVSGGVRVRFTGTANVNGTVRSANGTYTEYINATATNNVIRFTDGGAGFVGSIDNISVRELPGNHRYAPASGNRPIWSKRVNLLEKTEQFDDAYWTKVTASITANAIVAPNGTLTADKLVEDTSTDIHAVRRSLILSTISYTFSMYAKAAERTKFRVRLFNTVNFDFDLVSLIPPANATIAAAGDGWYRITATSTSPDTLSRTNTVFLLDAAGNSSYTGDGTSGLFIWGADLRPANQATGLLPLYQRVNTSSDYDTNGFPGYLKADGVDDFLQTNSIDFSAGPTNPPLGPELVVNGDFSSSAGWNTAGSSWTVASGVASNTGVSGNNINRSDASFVAGRTYLVTFDIVSITAGGLVAELPGVSIGPQKTTAGTYRAYIVARASGTTFFIYASGGNFAGSIDNVSIKEITNANLGADKITLCAGVRKLSDAAFGIISELSADINANNGAYVLYGNNSPAYTFQSKGSSIASAVTGASFAAPITNVVTGIGAISTDTALLRVNGTQVATSATDQGTGNYGNYPAYFFRRGGSSLPFNGYEYGNVAVGKLLTADQLTALETYMNGLTKAY